MTVPVAVAANVVKLPNAALRFKPPHSPEGVGAEGKPPAETAVVWKLVADHTIVPVRVALGITDHAYTEVKTVLAGDLKPGDEVVTTAVTGKPGAPGAQGLRR